MRKNNEYNNRYNKEHYKQLKVYLYPDEYSELDGILKELNISKVQFIRNAIKDLRKRKNTPKGYTDVINK